MVDLSQQLNDLEAALNQSFAEKDWGRFMELDNNLQKVLAGYKALGEFPDRDQILRIRDQYQTMRTDCIKRREHLSQEMASMRQQKGALNAYAQCSHAGNR